MTVSIGLLRCAPLEGRIGIMPAPGTGDHTLAESMLALSEMGIKLFVTLLTEQELGLYGLQNLRELARAHGIGFVRYEIEPFGVPRSKGELGGLIDGIVGVVSAGQLCAISCCSGMGRSGTIAACCLVRLGATPEDAISAVRRVRPEAIETFEQEEFIRELG